MKLYKKVFLTLSGAGMLAGCCETKRTPPPPVKLYRVNAVVVVQRDNYRPVSYLCDTDGDGMIDMHVDYAYFDRRRLLRKAVHIGDTIKFYTENPHDVYQSVYYHRGYPDSVNDKSRTQLLDSYEKQMQINELRQSVTPQKQR